VSSVPTELTVVQGVVGSERRQSVCFRAYNEGTRHTGQASEQQHATISVYCASVKDPSGPTPDLRYARYRAASDTAASAAVPHDLVAVGPDLVFVMSVRASDSAAQAATARDTIGDNVYSVYRLYIARVLEFDDAANSPSAVRERIPTLIKQQLRGGLPFSLPVLKAPTLHELPFVSQRHRSAFSRQYSVQ